MKRTLSFIFHFSETTMLGTTMVSKTKLTLPVLALGGGFIPGFVGNVTINYAQREAFALGMHALAQNVRGIQVPNSRHWIPEERPDFVIKLLTNFFGGNITNTI